MQQAIFVIAAASGDLLAARLITQPDIDGVSDVRDLLAELAAT